MVCRAIRQIWSRVSPERSTALYLAKVGKKFQCAHCDEVYDLKEVQVDHIKPVGKSPEHIFFVQFWINALFCSIDNLQVLCKRCHKVKTKQDIAEMRRK